MPGAWRSGTHSPARDPSVRPCRSGREDFAPAGPESFPPAAREPRSPSIREQDSERGVRHVHGPRQPGFHLALAREQCVRIDSWQPEFVGTLKWSSVDYTRERGRRARGAQGHGVAGNRRMAGGRDDRGDKTNQGKAAAQRRRGIHGGMSFHAWFAPKRITLRTIKCGGVSFPANSHLLTAERRRVVGKPPGTSRD